MGGKMAKGTKMAAAGFAAVGVAAVVAGKQLYDLGAQFDDAYDTIRVRTGATGRELEKLKGSFRSVAKDVPNDFDQVGTAIGDLNTRLGLTGRPLERMAQNMLHLSNITGDDLEGNIKSVARAFVDWEVTIPQQTQYLDGLFRLSQRSGASVGELTDAVQKFGSPLRQLGFNFAEAASMFANFERAGVNTQTMVPGLRLAISNLTRPTETLAATMAKLGIEAGKPDKALRQVFELLGASSNLSQIEKTGLAMDVFGKRAGADMAEAIKQGRFEVDAYLKLFRNNQGDTIRKAANESYDFSENVKILANNLKVFLEPAANRVFVALSDMTRALRQGVREMNGTSKRSTEAGRTLKVLREIVYSVGKAFQLFFRITKRMVEGVIQIIKNLWQMSKNIFRLIIALITSDWKKAWDAAKRIVRAAIKVIVGVIKTVTAPVRSVFQGIVEIVRDKFKSAYNAAVNFVNGIIKVINEIPGVEIGFVGGTGGGNNFGEGSSKRGRAGLQRGGFLMGGKPSGDSIPAMLERGEYVLNREAVKKVGVDRLNKLNFQQAARFQRGGRVGLITGGDVADAAQRGIGLAKSAIDLVAGGPGAFIELLPKPNLPEPIAGLAPWLIDKATGFIKDKVANLLAASSSGVPGYTGPPPDFKQLGNNSWVDSNTLAVGYYLANKFGVSITDGWRPQNASYGAVNSSHKRGTPGNPGALDFAPPSTALQAFAGKHIAGLTENDIHDWGTGLHNHIAFFQRGGEVLGQGMRGFQKGGWVKMGATIDPTAGQPQYGNFGGMSFAELLVSGTNSYLASQSLASIFGLNSPNWVGMPMRTPLKIRMPGRGPGKTIYKLDNGSGQAGNPWYKIDLHQGIANALGWRPNQDVEVARTDGKAGQDLTLKEKRENKIQKLWGAVRSAGRPKEKDQALWKLLSYYAKVSILGKDEKSDIVNLVRNGKLMGAARYFKKNGKVSGEKGENENFLERLQDAKKWARIKEKREREIAKLWRQYDPNMSPLARYGALWPLLEAYAQYSDIGWKGKDFITNLVSQGAGKESASQAVPFLEKAAHWFTKNGKISGGPANDNFLKRLRKAKGAGQSSAMKQIRERALDYPQANMLKLLDYLISFKDEEIEIINAFHQSRESASPVMPEGIAPDGTLYTEDEVAKERGLNLELLGFLQDKRSTIGNAMTYLRDLITNYSGRVVGLSTQRDKLIEKAKASPPPKRKKLLAQAKLLGVEIKNVKTGISKAIEERDGNLTDQLVALQGYTGQGGKILQVQDRLKELGYIISDQTPPTDGGGGDDTPLTDPTDGADDGRLAEIAEILRQQLFESQRALAISQAQIPIFQQYLPRYHSGGIVGGYQAGGEVPIMAQAGEGIFTRDQMRALSPNPNVTVVIEDGAIDKSKIRVEVDGVLADKISSARRQIPGRSYASR